MIHRLFLVLALILPGVSAANAEAPRSVVWKDLLPKGEALVDPLAHLTVNQRIELRLVAAARKQKELGLYKTDDRSVLAERNLTRKLQDEGLDVETLLAQFVGFQAKVTERSRMVDASLDTERVRLSGHVLPLEISEAGVREFLLVPFVGACIHVPAPPPNQVIVVRTAEPIKDVGMFATVSVTGRLTVEAASRKLWLVDGVAPVPAAYALRAERVELDRD
jgi:nickel/cobalt transporter (NicO) family protein